VAEDTPDRLDPGASGGSEATEEPHATPDFEQIHRHLDGAECAIRDWQHDRMFGSSLPDVLRGYLNSIRREINTAPISPERQTPHSPGS
jgi:hypothetical protein